MTLADGVPAAQADAADRATAAAPERAKTRYRVIPSPQGWLAGLANFNNSLGFAHTPASVGALPPQPGGWRAGHGQVFGLPRWRLVVVKGWSSRVANAPDLACRRGRRGVR